MSNTELLKLAERCEKATGPESGLDCWIENRLGLARFVDDRPDPHSRSWLQKRVEPKAYTASVDAAMMLVPEGWAWSGEFCGCNYAGVWNDTPDYGGHPFEARAATPALALCAAALKARASQ